MTGFVRCSRADRGGASKSRGWTRRSVSAASSSALGRSPGSTSARRQPTGRPDAPPPSCRGRHRHRRICPPRAPRVWARPRRLVSALSPQPPRPPSSVAAPPDARAAAVGWPLGIAAGIHGRGGASPCAPRRFPAPRESARLLLLGAVPRRPSTGSHVKRARRSAPGFTTAWWTPPTAAVVRDCSAAQARERREHTPPPTRRARPGRGRATAW